MDEEVKVELEQMIYLFKSFLIKNGVSMALDGKGNIHFFDTGTYIREKRMSGISINIEELVK